MSARITNYGMDRVASTSSYYPSSTDAYFERWHRYTAVGTGSSTPSESDVALEAEVARTSDTGGFLKSETAETDSTNNVVRYTSTTYRVFNFSASYNLTEYGHFTDSTGSNAVFRDLFRQDPNDPNSAAITISVQSGDQLQIIKTFVLEVAWEAVAKTVTITGIGDIAGTQVVAAATTEFATILGFLRGLWPGETSSTYVDMHPFSAAVGSTARDYSVSSSIGIGADGIRDTYTSGSYTLRTRFTYQTNEANHEWYGWVAFGYRDAGVRFIPDTQPAFTKADTYTLEIWLDVSWARG